MLPRATMPIWFLMFLLNSSVLRLDLGPFVSQWALPLHERCLSWIPNTNYGPLYGAIVCGKDPALSSEVLTLQISGLYHLLVVSGAHLTFIQGWLRPFSKKSFTRRLAVLLLIVYTLMTNAQPPVVRAFVYWCLIEWHPLRSSSIQSAPRGQLYTGVICLTIFPAWSTSLSFWLSWLASLSIQIAQRVLKSELARHTLTHLILLPALVRLGAGHPFAILSNWILGPLFGALLLPLSIAAMAAPILQPLSDGIWFILIKILEPFCHLLIHQEAGFSRATLIIYICVVQIVWLEADKWLRRRN